MKKTNKKGFTLVELLAVIVILAVLILIALPNVMRLTDTAKKKAFINEAFAFITAAENQYASEGYEGCRLFTYDTMGNGQKPARMTGFNGATSESSNPKYTNTLIDSMKYKKDYRVIVVVDPTKGSWLWMQRQTKVNSPRDFIDNLTKNTDIDTAVEKVNDYDSSVDENVGSMRSPVVGGSNDNTYLSKLKNYIAGSRDNSTTFSTNYCTLAK